MSLHREQQATAAHRFLSFFAVFRISRFLKGFRVSKKKTENPSSGPQRQRACPPRLPAEQKIAPGFSLLTWTSMNIDGFLHRFRQVRTLPAADVQQGGGGVGLEFIGFLGARAARGLRV